MDARHQVLRAFARAPVVANQRWTDDMAVELHMEAAEVQRHVSALEQAGLLVRQSLDGELDGLTGRRTEVVRTTLAGDDVLAGEGS